MPPLSPRREALALLTTSLSTKTIMNTSQLTPFLFGESTLRTTNMDGEPWFSSKDVCEALAIANNRDAIASLDDDEKITVGNADGNPRAGIPHEMTFVNESGLYALIFKSRKAEAKVFRKWVTSEVLPSIRKKGFYSHRTEQLLSLVKDLLELGLSSKDAGILARGEFPALTRQEQRIEELKAHNAQTSSLPLDQDCLLFLSFMQPGTCYYMADFFTVLPSKHPLLKKSKRGWSSAIGICLQQLVQAGKIRKLPDQRKATYELIVQDNVIAMGS